MRNGLLLGFVCCALTAMMAKAEDKKVPYASVSKLLVFGSLKIDGENYFPCFLKADEPGNDIDAKAENFRMVAPDGEVRSLRVEPIEKSAILRSNASALGAVEGGYDDVLWIPKNIGKFEKGDLVHSSGMALSIYAGKHFTTMSSDEIAEKMKGLLEEHKKERAKAKAEREGSDAESKGKD